MPVTVEPFPAAALALLFDDGLPVPAAGDPLPPYWHLAACAVPPRSGVLRADGHPGDGPVTAPPHLPRRMFAGGRLTLHGQVRIGEPLTRRAGVIRVRDKQGRSGPLRFVTVAIRLSRPDGTPVLSEEQDIVYRAAATPGGTPTPAVTPTPGEAAGPGLAPGPLLSGRDGRLRAEFRAGPVALMRFSAATSNPHRIHYDHPYVTAVEGYPGLVVHGPLLLLALLELVRLDLPGPPVTGVSFRVRAPAFAGQPVRLEGQPGEDQVIAFSARDQAGTGLVTCQVTRSRG